MSERVYASLEEAAMHDPIVNGWLTIAASGRMSREEAVEKMALMLANARADLMRACTDAMARAPLQVVVKR